MTLAPPNGSWYTEIKTLKPERRFRIAATAMATINLRRLKLQRMMMLNQPWM